MSESPLIEWTAEDADRANEEWGFNCGPAAVCAVAGLTPEQVRPHLGDFEKKGYTNPTMMLAMLRSAGMKVQRLGSSTWPRLGIIRVQWHGPWMSGPPVAWYPHTHWIAARGEVTDYRGDVFDVNSIGVANVHDPANRGWTTYAAWADVVVPAMLREVEPRWNGGSAWHFTHVLEVALA